MKASLSAEQQHLVERHCGGIGETEVRFVIRMELSELRRSSHASNEEACKLLEALLAIGDELILNGKVRWK